GAIESLESLMKYKDNSAALYAHCQEDERLDPAYYDDMDEQLEEEFSKAEAA
ncbi:hypothetical protein LCGC14_2615360, partial [marine sediment metagenome]